MSEEEYQLKLNGQCEIVEDAISQGISALDADGLLEIAKLVLGKNHQDVKKLERLIDGQSSL